jgi:hypothetical protein
MGGYDPKESGAMRKSDSPTIQGRMEKAPDGSLATSVQSRRHPILGPPRSGLSVAQLVGHLQPGTVTLHRSPGTATLHRSQGEMSTSKGREGRTGGDPRPHCSGI